MATSKPATGSVADLVATLHGLIGDNDDNAAVTQFIDTGYAPLNEALSGRYDGGLPFGRMVEMFGESSCGKTALATEWMVQTQKLGGVAGFVDWERSFDVGLGQGFGLSVERPYWLYHKAETWESGNTWAARACKAIRASNAIADSAPILFVFDSIASAVPMSMLYDAKGNRRDIDTLTMNDTTALARVTSTTLKMMAQVCEEYNATFLYLNQIRLKIGVAFGDPRCLRGDVMVPFVDGTSASIETVVRRQINKDVWTYNEATGQMEPKPITGWHDNGEIDAARRWVHIRAGTPGTRNGTTAVTVTNDHMILTKAGWKPAGDIVQGDVLATRDVRTFDDEAEQFLRAVISFDCSVVQPRKQGSSACLSIQDNIDPEYAQWKAALLSKHLRFTNMAISWGGGSGGKFVSSFSHEIKRLAPLARDPLAALDGSLTDLQLAVAIMDDAHFDDKGRCRYALSLRRYAGNVDYLDKFGDLLATRGLTFGIRYGMGRFDFDNASSRKIAEMIARYVPSCMERKLPVDLRGQFVSFELSEPINAPMTVDAVVTGVRSGSDKPGKQRMFDITVADNHNFLAGNSQNGFVVHNCTPGGKAMEFYATCRIALGREKIMQTLPGGKQFIGQNIKMEVTKSKLTKPFKKCQVRMDYDEEGVAHFDTTYSLIELLLEQKKLVAPANGYVTWEGKRFSKQALADHIDAGDLVAQLNALLTTDETTA